MAKQMTTSISEFPIPDSLSTEMQVIADIISLPDTLMDAERTITADMFTDDKCRAAYEALRAMAKDGMMIDLPSVYGRIDQDLLRKGIIPMMQNTGGAVTAVQHYTTLKGFALRRRCYFEAVKLLMESCSTKTDSKDLVNVASGLMDELRRGMDTDKGMQHISAVLNDVSDNLEELQRNRESGSILRTPTGFPSLDFYTYGGFNAGNLVILAARPSVGKTAVMLHMVKAAAKAGQPVNIFSLEMTNAELVQRFLSAEGEGLNQWRMASGNVEWSAFERASGWLSTLPIYLNDSARTLEEISSRIRLNAMAGRCRMACIDYLGLMKLQISGGMTLAQATAQCTSDLKALAKECGVPIVLLCQLNRASASERRAPELHDLRDSGGIEQDADIVLMLERAFEDEDGREVKMWVRKNRQGKAGNVNITIVANETYSSFNEKGDYDDAVWHGGQTADEFNNPDFF